MENILDVGAGFIALGIDQAWAQSACRVYLMDLNQNDLDKGVGGIE